MADTMDPEEESHHVAAGVAYLVLAAIPVVLLTWHRNAFHAGSLIWIPPLGFLSGCAFHRAHFGSDSLPDAVERVRGMATYAAGIWATLGAVVWAVIGISRLF